MEYSGPYCYTLHLSGTEDNRVISKKIYAGQESKFKTPVTKKKTPKIYILTYKEQIVYIGYASQSMGNRMGHGIRSNGKNGYHGYKWKQVSELELSVFVFNQELKGNKHDDDKPYIEFAEAVEAELVYLVRQNTGKWPEFQNEIHFNNKQQVEAQRIAEEMYDKVAT